MHFSSRDIGLIIIKWNEKMHCIEKNSKLSCTVKIFCLYFVFIDISACCWKMAFAWCGENWNKSLKNIDTWWNLRY